MPSALCSNNSVPQQQRCDTRVGASALRLRHDEGVSLSADELHRRAVALSIGGRHSHARRALDRAAARTDDPDLHARIIGTRAYILQVTGAPDAAVRLCREALAVPGLSAHTRAVLAGQLGALAAHGGKLDEADRWLSQAIADLSGDPVAAARTRMNRSLVSLQRRRLETAIEDLQTAVGTFHDAGLTTDEGQARHNLGYTSLLAGDLVDALSEMAAARPFAATSPVAAAIGDVDRAEALREAGLTGEAERILAETAAVFGAHRMPHARAEAELQLARSLLVHDPAAASRAAHASARRFRSLQADTWAVRAEAVRLRADLAAGQLTRSGTRVASSGRAPSPEHISATADELVRRGFPSEAAALRLTHALWQIRTRAPRPPGGAPDRSPGTAIRIPASASPDVRLLAHEVRATRALAGNRNVEARRQAAAGLDTLEAWSAGFGSIDLHTSASMHSTGLLQVGLAAAIRSGRPDVVLEWSERARHAAAQIVPLRPPPDPELASDLAELRMLRSDRSEWQTAPRAREVQERVRQRQWLSTASASVDSRATVEEVQARLDEQTALVAFVFSGDVLSALVVTRQRAQVHALEWSRIRRMLPGLRSDLDMVATVRGRMGQIVRRALEDRLRALSAELFDGPLRVPDASRIVITAPGVLSGIPWSMLPALRARVSTLAISASRWVRDRGTPGSPRSVGFVLGPGIPRGAEEITMAAAAWRGVEPGPARSVADATAVASRVELLHIAAHGRHAADNPMFSGLELADGSLFGYDIDLMPRLPETVVLSACEAGRSSVRWGEEAVGMARIWLHAGTRCVIAAPVVVADDDACELLGAMHEGLAAGESPSVALAAASARTGIVAPFQAHGSGF